MKGGGEKKKGIFWRIRGHDWSIINVRFTDATSQDRKCGGDVAKNQHLSERCIFWNVRLHLAIRVIKKKIKLFQTGQLIDLYRPSKATINPHSNRPLFPGPDYS